MEKLFCILCSDAVGAPLRRSAAEQLAVVLQGKVLAGEFVVAFFFKVARLLLICLKMLVRNFGTSDFSLVDRY